MSKQMWYRLFFEIPPEVWKKGRKSIQAIGGLDYAQNRRQIGGSQNMYRMRTENKGIETLL